MCTLTSKCLCRNKHKQKQLNEIYLLCSKNGMAIEWSWGLTKRHVGKQLPLSVILSYRVVEDILRMYLASLLSCPLILRWCCGEETIGGVAESEQTQHRQVTLTEGCFITVCGLLFVSNLVILFHAFNCQIISFCVGTHKAHIFPFPLPFFSFWMYWLKECIYLQLYFLFAQRWAPNSFEWAQLGIGWEPLP